MPSAAKPANAMMLPEQMDAWKHTIITPTHVQAIAYPDGRKGIIMDLPDHSKLTVVLSDRAAGPIGKGLLGPMDGPLIRTQDRLPGL